MSLFKKKTAEVNNDSISGDGTHAVSHFSFADALMMFIIALLCCTCIFPFIHIIAKSFSSNAAVASQQVVFWPVEINTQAYASILKDGRMTYSIVYSAIVTVVFAILGVCVTICAAYPLTKKDLPFRPVLSFLLMFPMYFGAGLIPTYLLYNSYHMLDTVWVLILPLIFSPYNMLVMKSFLQSTIPVSLEESAFLDGAGYFRILFKVVLPLSKPIIATLLLFYAVGRWNAYGDNLYYIKLNENLKMIQYLLYQMVTNASEAQTIAMAEGSVQVTNPEVQQAAAIMVTTLPILIVYPFVQKHFVKGAMIGSVKG
ncbi:MAG: carbohydrate ABC transporter permease [Clostridiales bacterium]|nr:carbohydrate ABC transporter permease [Clostridiales bacterium]